MVRSWLCSSDGLNRSKEELNCLDALRRRREVELR